MSALVDTSEIKARVSLLDLLVADGHSTRRAGKSHVLCCPLHEERSPSFTVFEDGRFKCFGCGASGDVISYVEKTRGLTFTEAAELLQARTGIAPGLSHVSPRPPGRRLKKKPWTPYALTDSEITRCSSMAGELACNERAVAGMAASRGWKPETIHRLAAEGSLGLHDGRVAYVYASGAKLRLRPLTPELAEHHRGAPFAWLFGKPDSLWRADQVVSDTETVHICEGETACVTLVDAGIDNGVTDVAVAAASASSWRDEWRLLFRERRVIIWPDFDDAGAGLRDRIVASLSGVARSIGVTAPPVFSPLS